MWRKGEQLLFQENVQFVTGKSYHKFANRTLAIRNVSLNDSGSYSCELLPKSNNSNNIVLHTLNVLGSPFITNISALNNAVSVSFFISSKIN